jgi:hypothetical protein
VQVAQSEEQCVVWRGGEGTVHCDILVFIMLSSSVIRVFRTVLHCDVVVVVVVVTVVVVVVVVVVVIFIVVAAAVAVVS